MIETLPKMEIVSSFSVGLDKIDLVRMLGVLLLHGNFTKCNVGLGFSNANLIAALTLNGKKIVARVCSQSSVYLKKKKKPN